MASNQVTSVDASVVAQQTRSTTNTATLAYNQLVSTLAQVQADPSSVSQNELQLLASTVSNAATSLQQTVSSLASQMQSSGGSNPSLASAYMQAKDLLQDLTSNVGRINNALYTGGSSLRLSGSPTAGYTAATVNANDGSSVASTSTGSLASQAIGASDGGSGGISTDTAAVQALQNTPVGNILTAVVQELVAMVKSGQLNPQTGSTNTSSASGDDSTVATQDLTSGGDTSTSSSSGFNQSAYEANQARESGDADANNPLLQSFMNVLDGFLQKQSNKDGNGSTNSKGKKPTSNTTTAGTGGSGSGGTTTQDATSGSGTGGTTTAASGSNLTLASVTGTPATNGGSGTTTAATGGSGTTTAATGGSGTTTAATGGASTGGEGTTVNSFADGATVDNSGVLGNPYLSAANINGFLLAVLLESYNSGQHDLLTEAQQLQALNNAKNSVRTQLAAARSSNSTADDPGGGNSAQVQDLEDQLQSMGDDAQLEQLNLQNLSQNQQQLLTMISNFMKNTNDDSMSIIRHIGGG